MSAREENKLLEANDAVITSLNDGEWIHTL